MYVVVIGEQKFEFKTKRGVFKCLKVDGLVKDSMKSDLKIYGNAIYRDLEVYKK